MQKFYLDCSPNLRLQSRLQLCLHIFRCTSHYHLRSHGPRRKSGRGIFGALAARLPTQGGAPGGYTHIGRDEGARLQPCC
jgi:hypothetical protein